MVPCRKGLSDLSLVRNKVQVFGWSAAAQETDVEPADHPAAGEWPGVIRCFHRATHGEIIVNINSQGLRDAE